MRDRDAALIAGDGEGLGVEQHGIAGGGVTRVADRQVAGQFGQHGGREDIRHVPHGLDTADLLAVAGGDAGAFLAAMLQREQTQMG